MDIVRAVDVSEFTGPIPPAWWRMLRRQHHVEAAIIQCWGGGYVPGRSNAFFAQQLEGALETFDLAPATYCWPPADNEQAIHHIAAYIPYISLFALDVEQGAGVRRTYPLQVSEAGLTPAIYASPSSWAVIMDNTRTYAHLPLWLARYIRQDWSGAPVWWPPVYDPFGGFRVGGWTSAAAWQFQGTTHIGTESCDLNLVHAAAFRTPKEIAMQDHRNAARVDALFRECSARAAAEKPLTKTQADQVEYLLALRKSKLQG